MPGPRIIYLVTRDDDMFPFADIPGDGLPTAVTDSYRTVAVGKVERKPSSWCFTDISAANALGRIIDGPIIGKEDVEKAECALRAILLYEFVEIAIPAIKVRFKTDEEGARDWLTYAKFNEAQQRQASCAAFRSVASRDHLFATELVDVRNGEIVSSTNVSSKLIGRPYTQRNSNIASILESSSRVINALPVAVGASAFYSDNDLVGCAERGHAGFIDEIYRRIERPWKAVTESIPTLYLDVKIPPLISIVLTRANFRKDIPEILVGLREELAPVRQDLARLNQMLDSSISQAELNAEVRRVNESFDAIVPESMLSDSERRFRRIASVFPLLRYVRGIYSAAVDPLAADPEKLAKIIEETAEKVRRNKSIVARSVAAAKFSDLLRIDSQRDLITTHFGPSEISHFKIN